MARPSERTSTRAVNNVQGAIQSIDDTPHLSADSRNWNSTQAVQDAESATALTTSVTPGPTVELPTGPENAGSAEAQPSGPVTYFPAVDGDISRASTTPGPSNDSPLRESRGVIAKDRNLTRAVCGYNSKPCLLDDATFPNITPACVNGEIGLLRYFRYYLAPWIDAGDPECTFAIQVLLLAKSKRSLLAAILALSSTHSCLLRDRSGNERSAAFRHEAEQGLAVADDPVGRTLIMLQDFFSFHPRQWRDFLLSQIRTFDSVRPVNSLQSGLSEPWWLLNFRIDLAASVISAQAPLMLSHSWLLPGGYRIGSYPLPQQQSSAKLVYLRALLLLAHCLCVLFAQPGTLSPLPEGGGQLAARSSSKTDFTSLWASLWTDCQEWYHDRQVEMQAIVDIRGADADQINPGSYSSFPILIYTTPLALLANAIYHITSFLLLTHRPRLLKTIAGPRYFTSRIWHAQAIIGIATSNEFGEQWDTILIAGLLTVARDMTHASQQSILLNLLGKIAMETGINLDHEIDVLRSGWDISQYDEETIG
ncbi:uncharacterized protein ATNIH1004_007995 [Aspergillus tanneri]|uniref:Transcription factor domain-containing protein n=1 Tax=Aspergillus tanneri TaxID=1220188 RepID=A0A5M9MHU8_9EURO|nr:uncharacterized protein ATNIH1004_007995 [Aspergillus tanneri]KAA8646562.1 hypothetical protein ATNIH1004_007995 [Aspergillus tanneri]